MIMESLTFNRLTRRIHLIKRKSGAIATRKTVH